MHAGATVRVMLPPHYEGATVTVVLVGKARTLVELPNGSQTWITNVDLSRRGKSGSAD